MHNVNHRVGFCGVVSQLVKLSMILESVSSGEMARASTDLTETASASILVK